MIRNYFYPLFEESNQFPFENLLRVYDDLKGFTSAEQIENKERENARLLEERAKWREIRMEAHKQLQREISGEGTYWTIDHAI